MDCRKTSLFIFYYEIEIFAREEDEILKDRAREDQNLFCTSLKSPKPVFPPKPISEPFRVYKTT